MRRVCTHRAVLYVPIAWGVSVLFFFIGLQQSEFPSWHGAFISKKVIADAPSGLGNNEDLSARDHYEWMRLRNPVTERIPHGVREKELEFARKVPTRADALGKGEAVGAIDWVQRGPFNVGGRTRALGIDSRDPRIMLAGGVSGGMWRSTNSGSSWQKVSPLNDLQSTTCLVQDLRPGKEDVWYYGTGEFRGNSASGGGSEYLGDGVFKSTDNGSTWSKLAFTSTDKKVARDQPFDYVWNLALSRIDVARDVVVAATAGTIQTSTDGGQTFALKLGAMLTGGGPAYTDVISTPSGVFYATLSSTRVSSNDPAPDRGIWRSLDGISWTNITPASWPVVYNRVVLAIAPGNEDILYALAETPGTGGTGHMFWKYSYLSGDGSAAGGIWENRSQFLPEETGLSGNAVFDSQLSYDLVVAVSPSSSDAVFIGGVNLYRSSDAGQTAGTWKRIGGYANANTYARWPNNHPDHHVLVFHPGDPKVLYNGNDGGVFRTPDAVATVPSWASMNAGYFTTQFFTIALDPGTNSDPMIVGGMQDNGTWYTASENSLDAWSEISTGDGGYCQITPGGATIYVSFQNGVTYRISQNGQGRIDPSGGSGYLFINPFLLDPAESRRMYMAGGQTIWRNKNLDEIPLGSQSPTSVNWQKVLQTDLTSGSITALGASTDPIGILYFGTSNGRLYKLVDAFRDVKIPQNIWTGSGFPVNGYVSSIAVDPFNGDHALVSFSNYGVRSIFATRDGGASWTEVSGNLEDAPDGSGNGPSVRWVSILPDSASYFYFAGTSTGLYSTRALNGGSTAWLHEGPGSIGYAVVDMIDIRESDGTVVLGTHGHGVFSAQIPVVKPTLPSDSPSGDVPLALTLSPNYPNPFNAGTAVTVSLSRAGDVTVEVYDIAGRLVRRIATGSLTAGVSAPIFWDGNDGSGVSVPTGIYIIVARSEGILSARKATLIR